MKKYLVSLAAGILIGALAFGGVSASLDVAPSTQKVFVNGFEAKVEAYNINGANYFKARDLAAALDVGMWYDAALRRVMIETEKNYDPDYAGTKYTVVGVTDGDTISINYNGTTEKVRLIGVDTPESVHPDASKNVEFGKVASAFTTSYLLGREVTLERDISERDRYGRLLAYVWVDGVMFNRVLLEKGYARASTFPPDVKYAEEFAKIEAAARESKAGLWADEYATEDSVKKTGTYVGSLDSDKYHYPACRYAEIIAEENRIWFDTVEEAAAAGYLPCGVCNPK